MISIDTVYQKVLALANKEQRGYITPQEFNLLADRAQQEIFDSYFHDTKTAYRKPQNQMGGGFNEKEVLAEKLSPFKGSSTIAQVANDSTLDISSIAALYYVTSIANKDLGVQVAELTTEEILYTESNPLTKATTSRPIYTRDGSDIMNLLPVPTVATNYEVNYYKYPTTPNWAYVVIKGKALYNSNASTNFTIHESEEEPLVTKILGLAGIVIQKPGLLEVAMANEANLKQSQND